MKVKLMPMLAAVMTLCSVATPFVVKAYPLLEQAQHHSQKHQSRWTQFHLAILTAEQREKLKVLRTSYVRQNSLKAVECYGIVKSL